MSAVVDLPFVRGRKLWWGSLVQGIWTVFLIPLVGQGIGRGDAAGWAASLGVVLFVGIYLWAGEHVRMRWRSPDWAGQAVVDRGLLIALLVETVLIAFVSWAIGGLGLAMVVFLAVGATMMAGTHWALLTLTLPLAFIGLLWFLTPQWAHYTSIAASLVAAVLMVWSFMISRQMGAQALSQQRVAGQLALVEQRERVARDLHDVLGHSLTAITLKAQVADALMDDDLVRARGELAEIERLAREALHDVRGIVEGEREVSLDGELALAASTLADAGIALSVRGEPDSVPVPWQELAAWTVREGVTNVVRHSGARRCVIDLDAASLGVTDDGPGFTPSRREALGTGRGLAGLRRRAEAEHADLEINPVVPQGFQLSLRFPEVLREGVSP